MRTLGGVGTATPAGLTVSLWQGTHTFGAVDLNGQDDWNMDGSDSWHRLISASLGQASIGGRVGPGSKLVLHLTEMRVTPIQRVRNIMTVKSHKMPSEKYLHYLAGVI